MAKNNTPMAIMVHTDIPPYEGRINERFLEAAKQSSSFLNDRCYTDGMMKDMLKADLIATGNFAIQNTIGGRAIAARIRDEASRIYGEEDVTTWFK